MSSPLWHLAVRISGWDRHGSAETTGSCFPAAMELPGVGGLIELTAKIHAFVPEGRMERVITAIAEHLVVLRPAHMTP